MDQNFIKINCACGKVFRVAAQHAGKKAKCPGCGTPQAIPVLAEPVVQAEIIEDAPVGPPPVELGDFKPCPYCSEPIKPRAVKCRHCGEFVSQQRPAGRGGVRPRRRPALQQDTGGTSILIFGILSWATGCTILGIIAWIQGSNHEKACRARGIRPSGSATGGKILGMIHVILTIIVVIGYVVLVVAMGTGSASSY